MALLKQSSFKVLNTLGNGAHCPKPHNPNGNPKGRHCGKYINDGFYNNCRSWIIGPLESWAKQILGVQERSIGYFWVVTIRKGLQIACYPTLISWFQSPKLQTIRMRPLGKRATRTNRAPFVKPQRLSLKKPKHNGFVYTFEVLTELVSMNWESMMEATLYPLTLSANWQQSGHKLKLILSRISSVWNQPVETPNIDTFSAHLFHRVDI